MVEEAKLSVDELPEGSTPEVEPVQEQPKEFLTEDKLDALLESKIDPIRKHFQGVADKQVSEAKRTADEAIRQAQAAQQSAQNMQQAYLERLKATDPKAALEMENQLLKAQLGQGAPAVPTYGDHITNLLDAAGVDTDDSRLDWAEDTKDPDVGMKRLRDSVKKILGEGEMPKTETKAQAEEEKPPEKKPEALPVELSGSAIKKPTQITREELRDMSPDEYRVRKEEIDKAAKEGLIK